MNTKEYVGSLSALKKFGFKKEKSELIYTTLFKSMKIIISLDKNLSEMNADVFDADTDEKYLPFYQPQKSEYAAEIAQKIDDIESEILSNCFTKQNIKEDVVNGCIKEWPDTTFTTWEKGPNDLALKNGKTNKGYALFAKMRKTIINGDKNKSTGTVGFVNLKLNDKVQSLIDNKTYFPAGGMNRKYGLTVLLNRDTNINELKGLIKESYKNVDKK